MHSLFLFLALLGSHPKEAFQILMPIITGPAPASGGTTPAFSTACNVSAANATPHCDWGVAPANGRGAAFVAYLPNPTTVTSISDGGTTTYYGSGGVAGTFPVYANGTSFRSVAFFACNIQGSTTSVTLTTSGYVSGTWYIVGVSITGQSTTTNACDDGYNKAQSTVAGTTLTSGTVTTTNAGDLMVGLMTNNCGNGTYAPGTDGAAHTYTQRAQQTQVVMLETLAETGTGTYSAGASTGAGSCIWNAEVLAIK